MSPKIGSGSCDVYIEADDAQALVKLLESEEYRKKKGFPIELHDVVEVIYHYAGFQTGKDWVRIVFDLTDPSYRKFAALFFEAYEELHKEDE